MSDEGRFRLFPFFPYDDAKRFEMLCIEMDLGCCSESAPHEEGTEELLMVSQGTLRLTVDGKDYLVEAGNAIRYQADKAHIYENAGETPAKLYMVIYYRK